MSRLNEISIKSYQDEESLDDKLTDFLKIGNRVLQQVQKMRSNQKFRQFDELSQGDSEGAIWSGYFFSIFIIKHRPQSLRRVENYLSKYIQYVQNKFGKIQPESELSKHWRSANKYLGIFFIRTKQPDKAKLNLMEALRHKSYGSVDWILKVPDINKIGIYRNVLTWNKIARPKIEKNQKRQVYIQCMLGIALSQKDNPSPDDLTSARELLETHVHLKDVPKGIQDQVQEAYQKVLELIYDDSKTLSSSSEKEKDLPPKKRPFSRIGPEPPKKRQKTREEDIREYILTLEKAAECGNFTATYELGIIHTENRYVKPNWVKGLHYFEKILQHDRPCDSLTPRCMLKAIEACVMIVSQPCPDSEKYIQKGLRYANGVIGPPDVDLIKIVKCFKGKLLYAQAQNQKSRLH